MPCCIGVKITAGLLSFMTAALPALGRVTVRCEDGSPCPPAAAAPSVHACCQRAEKRAECPKHLQSTPPRCVVELKPLDRTSEREQLAVSALLFFAILPQADFVAPADAARWSVVPVADESPHYCLAPKQGHSPRAPPCA